MSCADGTAPEDDGEAPGSGLAAGRNALLHAVNTPFAALMDDDLLLLDNTSLPMLHAALMGDPEAAVAGG